MAEWGWGSPSSVGAPTAETVYDWGYGSPSNVGTPTAQVVSDTGWGSPYLTVSAASLSMLSPPGDMPDEGGVLVTVLGVWPKTGPYRVRLYDQAGVAYPNDPGKVYCHSGKVGQGVDIFVANVGTDVLQFVLPPLPVGLFDLEILYGTNFGTTVTVTDFLNIVTRNRVQQVYSVRRRLQPLYKTGPRRSAAERLLP